MNRKFIINAQFVTLIVLLILASVSLSSLFSEKGLFKRAESASNRYNEAKAREVLETVLLADGQYEKNTNPEYNQDDFLNNLIKSEIPGSDVKGDVAIIGEYAYELDRSVPKIGRYLGKASDLVWPTVTASEPILADDYRSSTFTVTAIEEKSGINKIEIWFVGERIETLTKTYDTIKTEIKENFTVNRNGTYTIKVYGDLMASTTVEVTGILPAVEFSPNGSTEWKKEHTTKVIVKETGEKVTSLKYKWTTSGANAPQISEFTQNCPSDNIVTGGDNTMTGTYYLWILLTTETGKTNICESEGFNFDNQGPTVTLTSTPKSETSFTLIAKAKDVQTELKECKFYVNEELKEIKDISSGSASYDVVVESMGEYNCYVLVTDILENCTKEEAIARTTMHAWDVYTLKETTIWTRDVSSNTKERVCGNDNINTWGSIAYYTPYNEDGTGMLHYYTNCTTYVKYKYYNVPINYVFYRDSYMGVTGCYNGRWICAISAKQNLNNDYYNITRVKIIAKETTTYKAGSFIERIYNKNESAYPTKGEQDGKYYIYYKIE